jgi:hypothetical protein
MKISQVFNTGGKPAATPKAGEPSGNYVPPWVVSEQLRKWPLATLSERNVRNPTYTTHSWGHSTAGTSERTIA